MKDKDYDKLITKLETFKDTYSMISYMLTLDYEKKVHSIIAVVGSMADEKQLKQLKIFFNTLRKDMEVYKTKRERELMYTNVYNSIFDVVDKGDGTFDIGVDHDKIHAFLVDRYDLA